MSASDKAFIMCSKEIGSSTDIRIYTGI